MTNCTNPTHDDKHPSMAVYGDGHVHCYSCGWHTFPEVLPPPPEVWETRKVNKEAVNYLPWSMVQLYETNLHGTYSNRLNWLLERGLTLDTIKKLHLGYVENKKYAIPIWDSKGNLLNIKFRRDDDWDKDPDHSPYPKYQNMPGRPNCLYGLWQKLLGQTVWLCEGELDAALLMQEFWRNSLGGHTAIGITGGSSSWTTEYEYPLSAAYRVIICYDIDAPGTNGAFKAWNKLRRITSPYMANWPMEWGKDVTEAINSVGFQEFYMQCKSVSV